ncbi:MAG TPA: carbohydrate porin [Tepidisphaeraceae bacterium]|nr:carbohydrate porin [Tepidisphaeraceae bacterium]
MTAAIPPVKWHLSFITGSLLPEKGGTLRKINSFLSAMAPLFFTVSAQSIVALALADPHKLRMTRWFDLQPDLQYIVNPGGTGRPNALVMTLRAEVDFENEAKKGGIPR